MYYSCLAASTAVKRFLSFVASAMGVDGVLRHLEAVHTLLSSLHGAECFAAASAAQAAALKAMFRETNLSLEDAGKLILELKKLPWAAQDLSSLMGVLAEISSGVAASATSASVITRHRLQNYESFTNYLPKSLWEAMSQETSIAMERLVGNLLAMGLRNPTEPTVQKLTAVLLLSTEGQAAALSMQPMACHNVFKAVKKQLKDKSKGMPLLYVELLPSSADQFRQQYPEMHRALFASEGPVSCPFAAEVVAQVAAAIPMRTTKRGLNPCVGMMPMMQPGQQMMQAGMMQQLCHGLFGMMQQSMGLQAYGGVASSSSREPVLTFLQPRGSLATLAAGQVEVAAPSFAAPLQVEVAAASFAAPLQSEPEPKTSEKAPEVESDGDAGSTDAPVLQPHHNKKRLSVEAASKAILAAMAAKAEIRKIVNKRPAGNMESPDKKQGKKEDKKEGKKEAKKDVKKDKLCTTSAEQKKEEGKKPTFSLERTRNQVQCRTGLPGPKQNFAIPFGTAGEAAAIRKANVWLKQECKRRNLPCP